MSELIPDSLLQTIRQLIADAQDRATRSVNFERVLLCWNIGSHIVEEEQKGKERADLGITSSNLWLRALQWSMGVVFQLGSWSFVGSFTECSQLRTHCVRN